MPLQELFYHKNASTTVPRVGREDQEGSDSKNTVRFKQNVDFERECKDPTYGYEFLVSRRDVDEGLTVSSGQPLSTSFQQDHLVATVSGFRGSVSSEIGSEGRRAVFAHALRRAWGKVMRRWADGAGGQYCYPEYGRWMTSGYYLSFWYFNPVGRRTFGFTAHCGPTRLRLVLLLLNLVLNTCSAEDIYGGMFLDAFVTMEFAKSVVFWVVAFGSEDSDSPQHGNTVLEL
ncbi:hypothetical protein U1Q18_037821 [Sarracenia purpurea var. burkii]